MTDEQHLRTLSVLGSLVIALGLSSFAYYDDKGGLWIAAVVLVALVVAIVIARREAIGRERERRERDAWARAVRALRPGDWIGPKKGPPS